MIKFNFSSKKQLLPWALVSVCTVTAIVRLWIWVAQQTFPISLFDWMQGLGWGFTIPIVYAVLGGLIIGREPANRVGWLLMLPALPIMNPLSLYFGNFMDPQVELTPLLWLALWLDGWSWIVVIFPIFLIPLHFPTGKLLSDRWRWVNMLAGGMWIFFLVFGTFIDMIGPINEDWRIPNPIGFIPVAWFSGIIGGLWSLGLAAIVAASFISLIVRYRRGNTVQQQQIKWLLLGAGSFAFYYIATLFVAGNDFRNGWVVLFFVFSIIAIPSAIAIAILRYRLYDIDIIIRRTLQYTLLTGILALVYFGSITLLQSISTAVFGLQSPVFVVISTLAIAALFNPLRYRIQEFIDRRFYRSKYDAEQALSSFARVARDVVDIEHLSMALLETVETSIAPEKLSLMIFK